MCFTRIAVESNKSLPQVAGLGLRHPAAAFRGLIATMVISLLMVAGDEKAVAQSNQTWNGSADTNWNSSSSNWLSAGVTGAWTSGTAVFPSSLSVAPGNKRAITVVGTQNVTALTVSGTGYSFTGGTLATSISSAQSNWTFSQPTSISSGISATLNSGTLRFNPAATSGATTLSGPVTVVGTGSSALNRFTVNGNGQATFNGSAVSVTEGYMATSGTVLFQNSSLTVTTGTGSVTPATNGLTVTGGTTTIVSSTMNVPWTRIGTTSAALTLTSGTLVSSTAVQLHAGGGNTVTLNLDGGTLQTSVLTIVDNAGGTSNVNFNGSLIGANSASNASDFLAVPVGTGGSNNWRVLAGGAKFDTNGYDITIVQPLVSGTANDGGLSKSGSGTLTLTALSSYVGKTSVLAGTLQANSIGNVNGGSSALGNPSSVANGTIDISEDGSLQYTGSTASTDRRFTLASATSTAFPEVEHVGTGTLTLNGQIDVATPNSGFALSAIQAGSEMVINGLITGSAGNGLFVNHDGKVTLANAANSFIGSTSVYRGVLSIPAIANRGVASPLGTGGITGGIGAVDIAGGSDTYDLTGTLQFTGPAGGSTNRNIYISGAPGFNNGLIVENTIAGQSLALSGTITSAGAVAKLGLSGSGNGVLSGPVVQSGSSSLALTKLGSGIWTITGATTYTGTTNVLAGTLLVNGTIASPTSVAAGGVLGGTGLISGSVSVAGGTVRPAAVGAGQATLAMNALGLDATSTAILAITGTGANQFDALSIATTNGLTYGGLLDLSPSSLGQVPDDTSFALFQFSGSAAGQFAGITPPSLGYYAGLTFTGPDGSGDWFSSSAPNGQQLKFSQSSGQLVVVVPEPGLAVVGIAAAWVFALRRRMAAR